MTLMEWLDDYEPTVTQRLVIGGKVVDFYLRKISHHQYQTFLLEQLLVSNYSPQRPHLAVIRKNERAKTAGSECTLEKAVWNLGVVLDNLINQGGSHSHWEVSAAINSLVEEK